MRHSKIAELEGQRISLIHKLGKLSVAELNYCDIPGKWSIINILEHLVVSEEMSVGYAARKIANPDKLKPVNIKSRVYGFVLNMVLRLNIKYKAPEIALPKMSGENDLTTLSNRWEKVRVELYELSAKSPDLLHKGVLRHPYVGFMNFGQMLTFFGSHFNHHLVQVNRLVEVNAELAESR